MTEKKNPGGQPGNTNALKHGFYCEGVSPALAHALERAKGLTEGTLYEEIKLARSYLSYMLQEVPANHDIINRLLNTIVRAVAIDHGLNRLEEDAIGGALQDLLAELLPERDTP
jgi:hypothetical protein